MDNHRKQGRPNVLCLYLKTLARNEHRHLPSTIAKTENVRGRAKQLHERLNVVNGHVSEPRFQYLRDHGLSKRKVLHERQEVRVSLVLVAFRHTLDHEFYGLFVHRMDTAHLANDLQRIVHDLKSMLAAATLEDWLGGTVGG